jgi:hypothetical protein
MLISTGGHERTEAEYRELLGQADLQIEQIIPTGSPFSIIIGMKA